MLDRSKVMRELRQLADKLFPDYSYEWDIAQKSWQRLAADQTFIYKVREINNPPWPVPIWVGTIDKALPVTKNLNDYIVISVDGSQIYPDRHNNASCFLINIGSVVLPYGVKGACVTFDSTPHVFTHDNEDIADFGISTDLVDCRRQELELQAGLELSRIIKMQQNRVLLFDGSLIFWHLAAKEIAIREKFLASYYSLLYQLYEEKILLAGYISLPKSKELLNLIRLELCSFNTDCSELYAMVDRVIDSTIIRFFLKPFERSIVFQNRSAISKQYPACIVPHFFYLHVGTEIGRVEIPAWIAQNENLVSFIASVILDQSIKGHGYPVALAEAHEQAVVKGPDRDFFYHELQKIGTEKRVRFSISQKSLRKRKMNI